MRHHLTALVALPHNLVCLMMDISTNDRWRPHRRITRAGLISQDIAMLIGALASDRDPGLAGGGSGRIYSYHNPHQVRRAAYSGGLDAAAGPECTRCVLQQFSVQFLAT